MEANTFLSNETKKELKDIEWLNSNEILNTTLYCEKKETIIFHYNKHHNIDINTPPWIIKFKGQTYYINHMDIMPGIGFSTNETPDNPHTKATLKIKGRILIFINKEGKSIAKIF